MTPRAATAAAMFLVSFGLVLFELALTRLFSVVLFASWAHLAIALALLGISVGALAQHLWPRLVPEVGFESRLAAGSLLLAGSTVVAVAWSVAVPVTTQWAEDVTNYGDRASLGWSLVNPYWFATLLPVLSLPFAVAGACFAAVFQRRKDDIGLFYGADLLGGAAAAAVFVPLLHRVPGPDVAFVVAAAGALSATGLFLSVGRRGPALASVTGVGLALAATWIAGGGDGLLKIRFAAGYSEENVQFVRWTPLTRLAVHEDVRGPYVLLDNASASQVVTTAAARTALAAADPNRSLVYQLVSPPAKVAILAASAGPEVAVAQEFGHADIDAVDIASEIGDLVAERWPDSPVNPFLTGNTHRIGMDGRAAILHADHAYDVIQMVHANLHSAAGQLSTAWSPALLETEEAFETYLSRLTDRGVLSFGLGGKTRFLVRACAEAFRARGVSDPERRIVWIQGPASLMLAKAEPWTKDELREIRAKMSTRKGQYVHHDPTAPPGDAWAEAMRTALLTDDRPYAESRAEAAAGLAAAARHLAGADDAEVSATTLVYHTLALQLAFMLLVGAACAGLPLVVGVGRTRLPSGAWIGLVYTAGLGYGYLAVETVLVHELVLFVGHPTYAITVVVLAMLTFSGLAATTVGAVPVDALRRRLPWVLVSVVGLGALVAFGAAPVLYRVGLGWPLWLRLGVVFVGLAPLGFLMGLPLPAALRSLPAELADLVPWAWALNGWTSVLASVGTVIVARLFGYHAAFAVALGAYAVSATVAPRLDRIGRV